MPIPLQSGIEWEEDPHGNANSHDGRTIRKDVRGPADDGDYAIVKRPQPAHVASENYALGMERVAYTLGADLGLPIPETWLEEVFGHPSRVQRRVVEARSWLQVYGNLPNWRSRIENASIYAFAALFDVWLCNTDRRDVNLLFEALPEGATPGRANGCRLWLIDYGACGLWPANKWDLGRNPVDLPEDCAGVSGRLHSDAENVIAALMPPEYRMALKNTQGDARVALLDRVRQIGDDQVDAAFDEIPEEYISTGRADATKALLKDRRDVLDRVLDEVW